MEIILRNKTRLVICVLFILTSFALAGCSSIVEVKSNETKSDLYENSKVVLERSGMFTMQEYAIQKITIDEKGLLYETFYPNLTLSYSVYTKFERDEYEALVEVMRKNDFEHLEDNYISEVMVADVGSGVILLKNDFKTKSVNIDPYIKDGYPSNILAIMEKIDEIVSNAKSPFKFSVNLKYQPMQCQKEVWTKWYEDGNINYIMAPTEKQLITDYYVSKEIEIISINEKSNEKMVCEACDVCPKDKYYVIEVNNYDKDYLIENGWEEILE